MTVLKQWNEVEAKFASEYGLSLGEVFDLTWRRFRILFRGVFTFSDDAHEENVPTRIADTVDWSKAQHRSVQEISTEMNIPLNRVKVGKDG